MALVQRRQPRPDPLAHRLTPLYERVQWVLEGSSRAEDLVAWLAVLEQNGAELRNCTKCRALVAETRRVGELYIGGVISDLQLIVRLESLLRAAADHAQRPFAERGMLFESSTRLLQASRGPHVSLLNRPGT